MAGVVVRFAPSPTGHLHIGNVRAALLNYLFARQRGGRFILRFDDTDQHRSSAAYIESILDDLQWLGIEPDEILRQSERKELYASYAEILQRNRLLYPCYETEDILAEKRRQAIAQGIAYVYDREMLRLTREQRCDFENSGCLPHWRFLLSGQKVTWHDLVCGAQSIDTGVLSDPVLMRADRSFLYMLTSVVDDILLGVTHIVRGNDHRTTTAIQIELFESLGATVPEFAHYSLSTTADGEGLSKRLGSRSVLQLRHEGIEPMALASFLALSGTSDAIIPCTRMQSLIDTFSFEKLSRSPVRFDEKALFSLNTAVLQETAFPDVAGRLREQGYAIDESTWQAIRGNIERLSDVKQWEEVIHGVITPVIEDPDFTAEAATILLDSSWDSDIWADLVQELKKLTGRNGHRLYLPLRLALTGLRSGPELSRILPLIGKDKAVARLSGRRA